MNLLRPLTPIDGFFLLTVVLLTTAGLTYRVGDRPSLARPFAVAGWGLTSLFWAATAWEYLATSRAFLGGVGLVTVGVAVYTMTLVMRQRRPGANLTVAFALMGVLFVPFEFVEPIHRGVLDAVATQTSMVLSLAGYNPIVGHGPKGYANVIYFSGRPITHSVRIVSACTGISAIALFVGLVGATDAVRRQRALSAIGLGALIYILNLVRTVFVTGALAGRWFAVEPIRGLFDATDPAMASYYVAEYVIAQVLVVVVLLFVYVQVTERLPELQAMVDEFLAVATADLHRLFPR